MGVSLRCKVTRKLLFVPAVLLRRQLTGLIRYKPADRPSSPCYPA